VKAAVVGAGRIARQHLECLTELAGADVVAVCDLSPVTAEAAAERFGVPHWFVDHQAMLAECEPDVVHVTTPPASHVPVASDALRAGAHVIVEKPITPTLPELDELLGLASETGRHVVEDHNYVFNSQTRRLLELRDTGALGEVVDVEVSICLDITAPGSVFTDPNLPHGALAMPGGAIADFLTHLASLACAFVGPHRDVRSVWTKRDPYSPLRADEMRAVVEGERGTAGLSFSSGGAPDIFRLRVQGTHMRAEANLFEAGLVVERVRGGPRPLQPVLNGFAAARDTAWSGVAGLVRKLGGGPGSYEGLWELVRLSYEAFRTGAEPPVSRESILAVNRLATAVLDGEPTA
jgi:predicted dehydrogenase